MENLKHVVVNGFHFTSKISLYRDIIQLMISNGYRWLEVSEFGTICFYRYKPAVMSWYQYTELSDFNSNDFFEIPLCSVVRF